MASRALIIAIEDYDGQLSPLPGNVQAGSDFRQWLIEDKGVPPENILFCASHECPGRTTGTTRTEIVTSIQQLHQLGADATEALYVYFSGHGFAYQSSVWDDPVTVAVTSNFKSWQQVDFAFLPLDALQFQLRRAMGPGNHYYFFDACRTLVEQGRAQVPPLGLALPPSQLGMARTFVLYAATQGMPTPADAHFGTVLLEGLRGRGRAKGWNGSKLQVTFDRLMTYVGERLRQREIDADIRSTQPGILHEFSTIPLTTCTVEVAGARDKDHFELVAMDVRQLSSRQFTFTGRRHELQLQPDDYRFELRSGDRQLPRVEPKPVDQPVDLYDAKVVTFQRPSALESFSPEVGPGLKPWLQRPMLTVHGAPGGTVMLHRLGNGQRMEASETFSGTVEPGSYELSLEEQGVVVARKSITIEGAQPKEVELVKRLVDSPARESILQLFGVPENSALVDFSSRLGPMANQDLGLWLALIGAGHILRPADLPASLDQFQLGRFDALTAGSSAVYVLAGFEEERPGGSLSIGQATTPLSEVPELQRVWEGLLEVPEGPHELSIQVPGWLRLDLATYALPNRITMVVLTEAARARSSRARGRQGAGRPQVRQFLLPLHSLRQHLHSQVSERLHDIPSLEAIRFATLAQERFARLAPVREVDPTFWSALLYGKWLDPVMSVLAAYELVRQGRAGKANLERVVANLRTYFPGLPDTEALAHLLGKESHPVRGLPLFLEGLSPLGLETRAQESRPGMRLDFDGLWTAWLGVAP